LIAVIDSNVYVYRAIKDAIYHIQSKNVLDKLSQWLTPSIVIHEVVWTLNELIGRQSTLLYVKALLSHRKMNIIPLSRQDISWSIGKIAEEALSLARYNDKIILSIAKRKKILHVSFDKQLLSQASKEGIAIINPYLT